MRRRTVLPRAGDRPLPRPSNVCRRRICVRHRGPAQCDHRDACTVGDTRPARDPPRIASGALPPRITVQYNDSSAVFYRKTIWITRHARKTSNTPNCATLNSFRSGKGRRNRSASATRKASRKTFCSCRRMCSTFFNSLTAGTRETRLPRSTSSASARFSCRTGWINSWPIWTPSSFWKESGSRRLKRNLPMSIVPGRSGLQPRPEKAMRPIRRSCGSRSTGFFFRKRVRVKHLRRMPGKRSRESWRRMPNSPPRDHSMPGPTRRSERRERPTSL